MRPESSFDKIAVHVAAIGCIAGSSSPQAALHTVSEACTLQALLPAWHAMERLVHSDSESDPAALGCMLNIWCRSKAELDSGSPRDLRLQHVGWDKQAVLLREGWPDHQALSCGRRDHQCIHCHKVMRIHLQHKQARDTGRNARTWQSCMQVCLVLTHICRAMYACAQPKTVKRRTCARQNT
jgi:hypothetical protein